MALQYDRPNGSYTSTIPPGTEAFRTVVQAHYGFRTEVIRDQSRCAQQTSEHCECRAIDFFVQAPAGRPLFEWAVAHADPLGIQSVIHNHRVWGFGDWTERAYTGPNPHTDHVHIGLNKAASKTLTKQLVKAQFDQGGFVMDDEARRAFADLKADLEAKIADVRGAVAYVENDVVGRIRKLAEDLGHPQG